MIIKTTPKLFSLQSSKCSHLTEEFFVLDAVLTIDRKKTTVENILNGFDAIKLADPEDERHKSRKVLIFSHLSIFDFLVISPCHFRSWSHATSVNFS